MYTRLTLIGLAAAALLVGTATVPATARSDPFFVPNAGKDLDSHDAPVHRPSHYDVVVAEQIRRCADLSSQFNQALARTADSPMTRGAMPDYRQGVTLCDGGARMQGVATLEAALKEIGAVPHISY